MFKFIIIIIQFNSIYFTILSRNRVNEQIFNAGLEFNETSKIFSKSI